MPFRSVQSFYTGHHCPPAFSDRDGHDNECGCVGALRSHREYNKYITQNLCNTTCTRFFMCYVLRNWTKIFQEADIQSVRSHGSTEPRSYNLLVVGMADSTVHVNKLFSYEDKIVVVSIFID